jgi:hypothetical protein
MNDGKYWAARMVDGQIQFYRADAPMLGAAMYQGLPHTWGDLTVDDFGVREMTDEEKGARDAQREFDYQASLAQQEADRQAAEVQAAIDRVARLQALTDAYGDSVVAFVQVLSVFGIALPITMDQATPVIYAVVKADVNKTADSQLVTIMYQGLSKCLTDDEIYAIAKARGVAE